MSNIDFNFAIENIQDFQPLVVQLSGVKLTEQQELSYNYAWSFIGEQASYETDRLLAAISDGQINLDAEVDMAVSVYMKNLFSEAS